MISHWGDDCGGAWSTIGAASSVGLAIAIECAQGRRLYCRFVLCGKSEFHETKEIFQNFRITLYARLPVLIDAPLESGLSLGNLVGMRWCVIVVVRVGGDAIQVSGVGSFPAFCEESEVFEDIVLCMCANPRTTVRSISGVGREESRNRRAREPYVAVNRPHHAVLSLLNGHLEPFGLAIARHRRRGMTDCAVGIHPDEGLSIWVVSSIHLSKGWWPR